MISLYQIAYKSTKVIHVKEFCVILYYNRAEFEAILNYYDLYEHSDVEKFL